MKNTTSFILSCQTFMVPYEATLCFLRKQLILRPLKTIFHTAQESILEIQYIRPHIDLICDNILLGGDVTSYVYAKFNGEKGEVRLEALVDSGAWNSFMHVDQFERIKRKDQSLETLETELNRVNAEREMNGKKKYVHLIFWVQNQ